MFKSRQESASQPIHRFGRVTPKSKRRIVAALCLVAAAIGAVLLKIKLEAGSAKKNLLIRMDHPLPSLAVEDSDGTVDLKTFVSGTRSVIVFYSPSCRICKKVLPALRPFPDTLRLILVNVSTDQGHSEFSEFQGAARFHDKRRILSKSFAAAAVPTILFVDEAGILRDGIVGLYRRGFVQRKLKMFAAHSYDPMRQD